MAKSPEVFVREATGLTKQISMFSAFAYNVNAQTVAFAVTSYSLILAFTPGADATLSFLVGMIFTVPFLLVYVLLTSAMPRSGGEYVFTSRILSPWLASLAAFVAFWNEMLFLGINTSWIPTVYVSAPLVMMGTVLNSPALVGIGNAASTPTWALVIGTIVIVGVGVTLIAGTGTHVKFQNVIFIIGTISAFVMIGILLSAAPTQFVESFNRYVSPYMTNSTDPYHDVIKIAQQQGFTTAPFSWYATFVGMTASSGSIAFGYFSTYCSGEMRRASDVSRQSIVMIGSMLFNALLGVTIAALIVHVAGSDFAGATFYLGAVAPSAWPFPVAPFLNLFIGMLTDNVILNILIALGWMAWGIATTAILFLMLTRLLFAWSFDRLIPSFFSSINERFHSPVNATIFIIVFGEILTYVFLTFGAGYAAYLTYGLGFAWIVTAWLFVSVAAIVFPYKARDMYLASVVNRYKIGKIPLVSIVGVLSTAFMLMLTWFFLTDSALGVNSSAQLTLWGSTFLIAALLYPAIYLVRKKQGIDLRLVFAAVPPE